MPKFVKSGKYYYKINQRTKEKTRISKDEYIKQTSSQKKVNNKYPKSKKRTIKKHKIPVSSKSLTDVQSSNRLDKILHEEIRKKIEKIGEEKITRSMVNFETELKVNGKKYNVYAKVGKYPDSNYYIYNVVAKHISNNNSYQTVYQRSLVSSNPIL